MQHPLTVRPATAHDVAELATLLNTIIEIGGTTAFEQPLSDAEFGEAFLAGDGHICCFVAEAEDGSLAGFQSLERHALLPNDWGNISTFARVEPKVRGVGTALFAATLEHAREAGVVAINARIRADNTGGLAFYEKIGFSTYDVDAGVPLSDGTPVDRISKKYDVAGSGH